MKGVPGYGTVAIVPTNDAITHIKLPRVLRARLKALAAQREISLRRLAIEAFEAVIAAEDAREPMRNLAKVAGTERNEARG